MYAASISVFLLLVSSVLAEKAVSFQNYQVFSVEVSSQQQLEALLQFQENDGISFWKSPSIVGQRSDIMVAPNRVAMFADFMHKFGFESRLMINNVQRLIDTEQPRTRSIGFDWKSYQTLESIYEWLDEQLRAHPSILTGLEVGQSYENRTIRAVRLSHKAGNPLIFIEAHIHANEWITSATATWFLNQLLTSTDPQVQDLAQNIDWVIVPVFNVDGFAYTHKTNRLWRQTRQPHGTICYGADANRNFDHNWMSIGASPDMCDEKFGGPHAFSEPETRALANFIARFSGQIKIYFAFHSYSQMYLYPWGDTDEPAPNHAVLHAIALKAQEAIATRYGTVYKIGPPYTTIYPTSGISVDWVYATQNVSLAYTIEFRDKGEYGFLLPASQIIPNCEETLDGLIAAVKEARVHNLL